MLPNGGDALRRLATQAAQYDPEIGIALIDPAISRELAVGRLLAARNGQDLQRNQVWFREDVLTTQLNGRADVQMPVVPRKGIEQAQARDGEDNVVLGNACLGPPGHP